MIEIVANNAMYIVLIGLFVIFIVGFRTVLKA